MNEETYARLMTFISLELNDRDYAQLEPFIRTLLEDEEE
jgi:hypothetical protein